METFRSRREVLVGEGYLNRIIYLCGVYYLFCVSVFRCILALLLPSPCPFCGRDLFSLCCAVYVWRRGSRPGGRGEEGEDLHIIRTNESMFLLSNVLTNPQVSAIK